ncbi:glutathione S-transferase family protein [Flavisphingomonas formosensis]|uniref:glutathione S-transferase family protein n=1 Tax=Flavisphingomonas formosensis TaxID=861534 RepID=UPI0012F8AE70
MTLTLHHHPLASFCWKVVLALEEKRLAYDGVIVNLGEPQSRADHLALWPIGKMPVLVDAARGRTIPETSIIIEYLEDHHPGALPLLPGDADARLEVRLWDRFFDLYVQVPMQKFVSDHLRPADAKDPAGIADAKATLATAYTMLDAHLADRRWAAGDAFSMADCAAAPGLFYAGIVRPFADHPHLAAYFERLAERPSFRHVIAEAQPYFEYYPFNADIPARFRQAA